MHYYHVFVAEVRYQNTEPLTYSSEQELLAGTLVLVPYGRKSVPGFVASATQKPEFNVKQIETVLNTLALPKPAVRLHDWLQTYYPAAGGAITQLFVPRLITATPRKQTAKLKQRSETLPPLTDDQSEVVSQIKDSPKQAFLLHGETGSGKTRVYQELTGQTLESGRSVILLAPEISLIPQPEQAMSGQWGDKVVVLHSGLTNATRARSWLRILETSEPLIIIGTRSALFAPINSIGLILIDEMHEPAYRQESAPRYYALRVAGQAAKIHGSKIVYGSATPSITEYFVASQTSTPILRMTKTAKATEKVATSTVDLRDKSLFSRDRLMSDGLLAAIEKRLNHHEQSLLFLNRRGTARSVLCQSCGWQAVCPRCDIALTYHGDSHIMRCHICAYRSSPPYACPECSADNIVYRTPGTKALAESLQRLFPEAMIKRFDTDNLAAEQLSKHFDDIKAGKVDILVGTQMLGKGLDLPKLSLVGIVNADTSLGIPDFSSAERNYQLLHQAIGRVGRGHRKGEVIVQTFNPDNPLLKAALAQNWQQLYDQELKERQAFDFPPFAYLLKITVSRKTNAAAETNIRKIYTLARQSGLKIQVNEPNPAFYEKSHGMYNWQLIIRAKQRSRLTELISKLPKGDYTLDLDPLNLL